MANHFNCDDLMQVCNWAHGLPALQFTTVGMPYDFADKPQDFKKLVDEMIEVTKTMDRNIAKEANIPLNQVGFARASGIQFMLTTDPDSLAVYTPPVGKEDAVVIGPSTEEEVDQPS